MPPPSPSRGWVGGDHVRHLEIEFVSTHGAAPGILQVLAPSVVLLRGSEPPGSHDSSSVFSFVDAVV